MHSLSFSIAEAARALRRGETTSAGLVRAGLDAVRKHDALLNAVLHLSPTALEEAERLDAEARGGSFRGALHGIPLIIKDNIDVAGMPTTVGSPLFADAPAARSDATAAARLRAAGAVLLGKANLDELAAHVSGTTSFFGPTVNPWQRERRLSPGGSSSGTAAAMAAGYCCAGLGTDTGGSTRLPAGWCGLCGLRPTHGQIDLAGVYPRAASLDTVGLLARSVRDIEILLRVIADPPLRHALERPFPTAKRRIGVFPDLVEAKAGRKTALRYAAAMRRWESLGAACVPVDFPLLDAPAVGEAVNAVRSFEFARDVARDVEKHPRLGRMHPVPLADYRNGQAIAPETYEAARRYGAALTHEVETLFARHALDWLCLPVAFRAAPPVDSPLETFAAGRALVNLFSITGMPTLVVPGWTEGDGLPLGIQLVGPRLSERLLLDAGIAYEDRYGPFPLPRLEG